MIKLTLIVLLRRWNRVISSLFCLNMGLISALIVGAVGGVAIYGTGGLLTPVVAPMMGFSGSGIVAGSMGAAAQSYYGNLVAGSIISQMTAAMMAPTP
ncbi:hypothetical protein K1T71_007709 [Dendrolimus kikuchii]|uniref:Uncharacterized protein n=1 Tax=Dendrolimus kikuchii TaxID=765133 RepID=A0ACC1CY90_9NEOP|nr:hypothetical protein K1T71_007709 [Dendrolimus kikuchii]